MKRGRLITIGSFDGVHRGHQALLELTRIEARKRKLKSLALTFKIPPRMVLNAKHALSLLSDPIEKEILIRRFGIDEVRVMTFGEKLAKMRPFNFFRDELIRRLKAKGVVVGSDFRFGAGRSAGAMELVRWGQEFEIPVWVVPPVKWRQNIVSSSMIRHLIENNEYASAAGFLGHPYLIQGQVVKGQGLGKTLGFPTANLKVAQGKTLPRGVYAVRAYIAGTSAQILKGRSINCFTGVCNVGLRPTMGKSRSLVVEVHLLGRPGQLRGKIVLMELLHKLRDEKKFKSVNHLVQAIENDIYHAKKFINRAGSKALQYQQKKTIIRKL